MRSKCNMRDNKLLTAEQLHGEDTWVMSLVEQSGLIPGHTLTGNGILSFLIAGRISAKVAGSLNWIWLDIGFSSVLPFGVRCASYLIARVGSILAEKFGWYEIS